MHSHILLLVLFVFTINGCKPNPHPRHPNYSVRKPKVIHTPNKKSLAKMVKQLQGSPYVWAEEGPNNFDCSGFTYYIYGSMGIEIPRRSQEQARVGTKIAIKDLQYGDLIFFATKRSSSKINHVGMYLGDGWFTHASTVDYEVIYSNLFTSAYYKKRVKVCRRYLPSTKIKTSMVNSWSVAKEDSNKISMPKAIVIKTQMQNIEQTSSKGTFYVQVGSFTGEPKQALINTIRSYGYNYKIIKFPKNGTTISKLLIGSYTKREDALNILNNVRTNIQKGAFIAEIR